MKRRNPEEQRALHIATEAIAVGLVAPISTYIALTNPQLATWQRLFLYGLATSTLVVDGYLLAKWLEN